MLQPLPHSSKCPPPCHSHPGPYLCSSGDSLGAIHLNPASCSRSRAISRAHRAARVPPELPRGQNGAPHGDEHRAKPAPDQHPCTQEPCAPPPCPGRSGITRLLSVLKAALTSALRSPHALTSAVPNPKSRSGRGRAGTEGPCWDLGVGLFMPSRLLAPTIGPLWRAPRRGQAAGPAGPLPRGRGARAFPQMPRRGAGGHIASSACGSSRGGAQVPPRPHALPLTGVTEPMAGSGRLSQTRPQKPERPTAGVGYVTPSGRTQPITSAPKTSPSARGGDAGRPGPVWGRLLGWLRSAGGSQGPRHVTAGPREPLLLRMSAPLSLPSDAQEAPWGPGGAQGR